MPSASDFNSQSPPDVLWRLWSSHLCSSLIDCACLLSVCLRTIQRLRGSCYYWSTGALKELFAELPVALACPSQLSGLAEHEFEASTGYRGRSHQKKKKKERKEGRRGSLGVTSVLLSHGTGIQFPAPGHLTPLGPALVHIPPPQHVDMIIDDKMQNKGGRKAGGLAQLALCYNHLTWPPFRSKAGLG